MGGNTTVQTRAGVQTEPHEVDLTKVERKEFMSLLRTSLRKVNELFKKKTGKRLWVDESKLIDKR
jgi:hypothetical protein